MRHACLLQGEERKPPIQLSSLITVVSVEPAETGVWDPDQLTHWLRQLATWFRAGDFTAAALWRALGTCPATVLASTASLQRTFIELLIQYEDVQGSIVYGRQLEARHATRASPSLNGLISLSLPRSHRRKMRRSAWKPLLKCPDLRGGRAFAAPK